MLSFPCEGNVFQTTPLWAVTLVAGIQELGFWEKAASDYNSKNTPNQEPGFRRTHHLGATKKRNQPFLTRARTSGGSSSSSNSWPQPPPCGRWLPRAAAAYSRGSPRDQRLDLGVGGRVGLGLAGGEGGVGGGGWGEVLDSRKPKAQLGG